MARMSLPHSFQSHLYASSWFLQSVDPAAGEGERRRTGQGPASLSVSSCFAGQEKGWKGRSLDAHL